MDFLEFGFWNEARFETSVLEDSFSDSIFRYELEALVGKRSVNDSFFFIRVIIGTITLSAILILTLIGFVEERMIWLLFPTMTHVACSSILTSTQIIINHLFCLPVDAGDGLIRIN